MIGTMYSSVENRLIFEIKIYRTMMSQLVLDVKGARERGDDFGRGWYRGLWHARRMFVTKLIEIIREIREEAKQMVQCSQ